MLKYIGVFLAAMLLCCLAWTQSGSGLGIVLGINNSNFEFVNSEGTLQEGYKSPKEFAAINCGKHSRAIA